MSAEPALACCQDERDSRLRGQTPCQAMAADAAAHRWCGMDRSRFGPRSRQLCPCWPPRITPPCRAGDMTAAGSCGRRRATSPAGLVRPSLRARKPSRRGAFGATASGSDLTSPVPDCGGSQAETGVWLRASHPERSRPSARALYAGPHTDRAIKGRASSPEATGGLRPRLLCWRG
jgi:hypothetical protein